MKPGDDAPDYYEANQNWPLQGGGAQSADMRSEFSYTVGGPLVKVPTSTVERWPRRRRAGIDVMPEFMSLLTKLSAESTPQPEAATAKLESQSSISANSQRHAQLEEATNAKYKAEATQAYPATTLYTQFVADGDSRCYAGRVKGSRSYIFAVRLFSFSQSPEPTRKRY
ncbi:Uu.00g139730.m01.CDS01 [Anthostomella pinea]|uniref:Uu.00g139730.m01.CDS01 n=1 Tax=Anthostomella pinea TaxID=933095 RepID=A0AAI8VPZ9_9PEZI|nr:Uu.00g139730.m01.CDS01 [Anthostomella pinea]